jgi:hypothetical protein
MLDEATRQVEARLEFLAEENVLHEQLTALNTELIQARQLRLSAAKWKAARSCMKDVCGAVAQCRAHLRDLMRQELTARAGVSDRIARGRGY